MDDTTPAEQGLETEPVIPTSDPVEEAPEVEPGEKSETPPEEPGAKPAEKHTGVQKRIDELTRARHEAERKAAYWEGKASAQPVAETETDPAEARPNQDAYQSYEEYIEALADWKVSTRIKTERARILEEAQQKTVAERFEVQVKSAREKHADFDHVALGDHWLPTGDLADAIRQSNDGAEQAYLLGAHFLEKPEEWARIANLGSTTAQVLAIGRLQAKLEAKPSPHTTSNAPAPITPVRASDGTFSKDPEKIPGGLDGDAEWFRLSMLKR